MRDPSRHRPLRTPAVAIAILAIGALLLGACGESAEPADEFTSEWDDDRPVPAATVEAFESDAGVTIRIELANFVVSSPAAEDGDGHLHVAVDGGETQMTHETEVDLGELPPGAHEIHVGFVANDHRAITADGSHLASVTIVEIAPDGSLAAVRASDMPSDMDDMSGGMDDM